MILLLKMLFIIEGYIWLIDLIILYIISFDFFIVLKQMFKDLAKLFRLVIKMFKEDDSFLSSKRMKELYKNRVYNNHQSNEDRYNS